MKSILPLITVMLLILGFELATVSASHSWGDDFAQYILHARNLAEGIPYADTGYLQNPVDATQDVGPRMYPPLMPFVLSLLYRMGGTSLTAMKDLQAVLLIVAAMLATLYFQAAGRLQRSHAWLFLAALAFHPFLWESKEYISSELLFLAALYAALFLLEQVLATGTPTTTVMLGMALYACIATRTVGIVMLPVLGGMWLLRRDRSARLLTAGAICIALLTAQTLLLPSDNSYLRYLASQASVRTSLQNAVDYAKEFSAVWKSAVPLRASQALYLLSLPLAAWGAMRNLRKRIAAIDLLVVGYTAVILIWPYFQGIRFLLPLLPAYLLYLWTGAEQLHRHGRIAVAILLLAASAGYYATHPASSPDSGVTQPAFAELSRNLQTLSAPQDRFLFRKPRALAWMANRPTAVYSFGRDESLFWSLLQKLNIRYVVKADIPEEDFVQDREILGPFLDAHPEAFSQVYTNRRFTVYRVEKQRP